MSQSLARKRKRKLQPVHCHPDRTPLVAAVWVVFGVTGAGRVVLWGRLGQESAVSSAIGVLESGTDLKVVESAE